MISLLTIESLMGTPHVSSVPARSWVGYEAAGLRVVGYAGALNFWGPGPRRHMWVCVLDGGRRVLRSTEQLETYTAA